MSDSGHVLVANAGTLHVFQAAMQLRRHGLLRSCATSLFFTEEPFRRLPAMLRERALRSTANRRCAELRGAVVTKASPELMCLVAKRLGLGTQSRWLDWRNRRFCSWAARHCLDGVKLVWAFDTSSYELFIEARKRGIRCVLDMSIAHPALGNRLLDDYARRRPDVVTCLDPSVPDEALARRRQEIDLADRIVVGSSVVRDSLLDENVPAGKITVNPYGVDTDRFRPAGAKKDASTGRLRFLFVGWFSARKGIYDLIDAWESSRLWESGAELVLAGGGNRDLPCRRGPMPGGISLLGRVPHAALPDLYRSADVFVFPSVIEGSARVILEALASGLPVITTPTACDEEWVVEGRNGFRIAPGNPALLAERLQQLARDAALRARMTACTLDTARRYTWSAYGDRCAEVCRALLGSATC